MAERMVRHAVDELDAGMLHTAVGIAAPAPADTPLRLVRRPDQCLEPPGRDLGVVVQKKHEPTARLEATLIAASREAEVLTIENHPEPFRSLLGIQKIDRAVGG